MPSRRGNDDGGRTLDLKAELFIDPTIAGPVSASRQHQWVLRRFGDAPWFGALGRCDALFLVPLPTAPGLCHAGCVFRHAAGTASATGVGSTPDRAVARMAAEICEIVAAGESADPRAGYGASASPAQARSHAIHELIERTLVRMWWSDRLLPVALSGDGAASIEQALGDWGQPEGRSERFMRLRHRDLPPVHLAWSARPDDFGFVFGAACRPTEGAAARAALRELRQMVFGIGIAERRSRKGLFVPRGDLGRLRRCRDLDTRHSRRLDLSGDFVETPVTPLPEDADGVVARFGEAGLSISVADITVPGSTMHVFRAAPIDADPLADDDPYFAG